MPRVIGVDIPNNKRLEISLTYIFGIGRSTSYKVCDDLKLDRGLKAGELTEEQITNLATHIQKHYAVEGQLRRAIAGNISRLRARCACTTSASCPETRSPWKCRPTT